MTGSREEKDQINDRTKRKQNRKDELYDMFYVFDKDKSGYISSEELAGVMMKFGNLSKKEVDIMLADADIDGDGQVIYVTYIIFLGVFCNIVQICFIQLLSLPIIKKSNIPYLLRLNMTNLLK